MINSGIYRWRNLVNEKVYIGSAVVFSKRKTAHLQRLRLNNHDNQILQNSYNKHGEKNFVFEIIEMVPDLSNLISREQFYIDTINPFYNICRVAGSTQGRSPWNKGTPWSEEMRKKISSAIKDSNKTNNRVSAWLGRKRDRAQVERHRALITGFKHTSETKARMSIYRKGKKKPKGFAVGDKNSRYGSGKMVVQLDLNGNFIAEFKQIKQAQSETKITGVGQAAKGMYKQMGGFIWKYKDDYIKQII